jgi:hypothetical protein
MEVASFEEVGFCFPKHAHAAQLGVRNPNQDDIPISKHDNKVVHHVLPINDHDKRWVFGKNLLNIIMHVKDALVLGYGHIYCIESHGGVMFATYEVIIGMTPNCTCRLCVSVDKFDEKRKICPLQTYVFHFQN